MAKNAETRKKKMAKRDRRLLTVSIFLMILSILAVVGVIIWNYKPFSGENVLSQPSDITIPAENKGQYVNFLVAGIKDNLTDVIMVASVDLKDNSVNVLQIPRDCYVSDTITTGKINAVYNNGDKSLAKPNRLISEINKQFKLSISHYVTFTLDGFRQGVDAMGGIPINLPETLRDSRDGSTLKAGEQVLTGTSAEWFVRFRHGYTEGDIGRVKAQRIFLAAALAQAKKVGIGTLTTKVFPAVQDDIESDLSVKDIIPYVSLVTNIDMDKISMFMIPGEGVSHTDAANPTGKYDVYSIHKDATAELLNEHFRKYGDPVSADELGIIELKNTTDTYENIDDNLQEIQEGVKPGQKDETATTTAATTTKPKK